MVPILPGSRQEPGKGKRASWEPHFQSYYSVKLEWLWKEEETVKDLD